MKNESCTCSLCKPLCHCGEYAKIFSLLGNRNRLHIINALRKGEKNVTEVMAIAGMEQTSVSHSLAALKRQGFVTAKKNGKSVIYSLNHGLDVLMKEIDRMARKSG